MMERAFRLLPRHTACRHCLATTAAGGAGASSGSGGGLRAPLIAAAARAPLRRCVSNAGVPASPTLPPPPLHSAFVDIDGTLVNGDSVIPGAAAALDRLRAGVRFVRLVTNQTQESGADTIDRLHRHGFHAQPHEFFGALAAARRLVDERKLRPMLLLKGTGVDEFAGVDVEEPNAVVLGTAPELLHYEMLNEAMRVLQRSEESELIACNKGRYFRRPDGLALMAGPFVAALEFATGRKATVVGKPSPEYFLAAARSVAQDEADTPDMSRIVMIGDDFKDDVLGAMDVGMQAILLRTGKYRPGDEDRMPRPPLFVADDIGQAVDFLDAEGLLPGNSVSCGDGV